MPDKKAGAPANPDEAAKAAAAAAYAAEKAIAREELFAELARLEAERAEELAAVEASETERANAMTRDELEAAISALEHEKRVLSARQRALMGVHHVFLALDALPPSTGKLVRIRLGGKFAMTGDATVAKES